MTKTGGQVGVLLVDDSPAMLAGLGKVIEGEAPRMALVGSARTSEDALAYACMQPDVIVMDLALDACSSIEIIPELMQRSRGRVLVHTGQGDRRLHEDAMLFGATGVVSKTASAALILEAIECVHGGSFWNLDPSVAAIAGAQRNNPREIFSALGIDFLSPVERKLIADIVVRWHDASSDAFPTPVVLGRLVSIYNKLGLRNRAELVRFAIEHNIATPDGRPCARQEQAQ